MENLLANDIAVTFYLSCVYIHVYNTCIITEWYMYMYFKK